MLDNQHVLTNPVPEVVKKSGTLPIYQVNGHDIFIHLPTAVAFVEATILTEDYFKTLSPKALDHAALEWVTEVPLH